MLFVLFAPTAYILISGIVIARIALGIPYLEFLGLLLLIIGVLMRLGLPYAFYKDSGAINRSNHDFGWSPSTGMYVLVALIPLPPIGFTAAVLYLYRRHKALRVPAPPKVLQQYWPL